MAYITNSITSVNPGPALYAALETALLAEGYVLVDTVIISTRTHKILKSPSSLNVFAKDWFLDITFNPTGTSDGITLRAFEDFDPATDLAYRGPGLYRGDVGNVPHLPTWSWAGTTGFALETSWDTSTPRLNLLTTAFTFWISITPNRVIMMLSNTNTNLLYCGFYQPDPIFAAQAGAANFPLFCGRVSSSSFYGYLSRLPMVLDGSWPEYDSNLDVNGGSLITARYISQLFLSGADPTHYWHYMAFPVYLSKQPRFPLSATTIGTLMDVKYARGQSSGTQVIGDTCNVTTNPALTGGNQYALTQRGTHVYMFRTL